MCPEQQNKGSCKLTRCPYPHQSCTVKIEQSHIEQPAEEDRRQMLLKRRTKPAKCRSTDDTIKLQSPARSTAALQMTSINDEKEDDMKLNVKRYFDDGDNADATNAKELIRISKQNCDQINSTSECSNTNENVEKIIVVRKPIVGSLPSFIPIG